MAFSTILDDCALQDGWHRGRPCAGGCDEGDGSRKGAIHLAEICRAYSSRMVPKEVSGDLWRSNGRPKCDCTITRKAMAHWATLTLSQVLWGHSNLSECVRTNFSQAEKFFLCQTPKKRCQCDKTTQKKNFISDLRGWKPTQKVSKYPHLVESELVKSPP